MAGFVKGSKAHYRFLKARLLDVSDKLKSSDISQEVKDKLFVKQVELMEQLTEYFQDGEPK